jgi:acetolactate synthase-1/2/3 large subunit
MSKIYCSNNRKTIEKPRLEWNCSDFLVDFLIKHGITDVFGYAGGYIVPFMDALLLRKDKIAVHVCYNEQGCALAADGLARTSGKLGVYFTTSGPGAINALGGLADAWFDSVPVLGICGNVPTNEMKGFSGIRQNGFQEMDLVSITRNITKYSVTANSSVGFEDIVERAYSISQLGRKGGVIIDFPLDIQQAHFAGR